MDVMRHLQPPIDSISVVGGLCISCSLVIIDGSPIKGYSVIIGQAELSTVSVPSRYEGASSDVQGSLGTITQRCSMAATTGK